MTCFTAKLKYLLSVTVMLNKYVHSVRGFKTPVMNKLVGSLVFNGTVKWRVTGRRQKMNSGYLLAVHVLL